MTLEYLQQTMLSFKYGTIIQTYYSTYYKFALQFHDSKECVSVQCLEIIIKKPLPEFILNNWNFPKNGLHCSRFPENFLKVFKKRRTKSSLVWKQKQEERNQIIKNLPSFFGVNVSFPLNSFIDGFYNTIYHMKYIYC